MAPATAAPSPLRYATPGQLIFCLILFFLPWIELQCNTSKEKMMDLGPQNAAKGGAPKSTGPSWMTLATQSGMQIASGGVTFMGNQPGMQDMGAPGKASGPKDADAAPLLWLYPVAAGVGIIIGFLMPSNAQRKMVLAACCGLALVVPVLQAGLGFPIEKSVEKDLKQGMGDMGGGVPAGSGKQNDLQAEMKKQLDDALKDAFRVNYQIWFYLALIVPLGGLLTALIEPIGPPKRRKPLYDMDEDGAEIEDEDRPKKRDDDE